MGQRLVIVNTINGEGVNTLYYHWGAYTDSALDIVAMLRDNITEAYAKLPSDMDRIARFNVASLHSASGIGTHDTSSRKYISQYLTKSELEGNVIGNRNEGLIAFTEEDRESTLG